MTSERFKRSGFAPIVIIIIIAAAIILGGGAIYYAKKIKPQLVACTMEAKLCSDGSYVGRAGPNCEFAQCPAATSTQDVTADWKTYRNEKYGFEVKYPSGWKLETEGNPTRGFNNLFTLSKNGPTQNVGDLDFHDGAYLSFYATSTNSSVVTDFVLYPKKSGGQALSYDDFQGSANISSNDEIVSLYRTLPGGAVLIVDWGRSFGPNDFSYQKYLLPILSTFKFTPSTSSGRGNPTGVPPPTAPAASPVPKPIISNVPAGWQRYHNIKYGFEFLYPPDHTAYVWLDGAQKVLVAAGGTDDQVSVAEDEKTVFCCEPTVLKIAIANVDMRLDDWVDQNLSKYASDVSGISRKKTTVAGKAAVEITQPTQGSKSPHKIIVIQPGNFFVVVTESAPSNLLDQVFATLKF